MIKYVVLWLLTTQVPTECPDFKPDPYTGALPSVHCCVNHTKTVSTVREQDFDSKKDAQLFMDDAPINIRNDMKMVELKDSNDTQETNSWVTYIDSEGQHDYYYGDDGNNFSTYSIGHGQITQITGADGSSGYSKVSIGGDCNIGEGYVLEGCGGSGGYSWMTIIPGTDSDGTGSTHYSYNTYPTDGSNDVLAAPAPSTFYWSENGDAFAIPSNPSANGYYQWINTPTEGDETNFIDLHGDGRD